MEGLQKKMVLHFGNPIKKKLGDLYSKKMHRLEENNLAFCFNS